MSKDRELRLEFDGLRTDVENALQQISEHMTEIKNCLNTHGFIHEFFIRTLIDKQLVTKEQIRQVLADIRQRLDQMPQEEKIPGLIN